MRNNLTLSCLIFLLLSACTEKEILNPLEKRLSGRWIEVKERKGQPPSISGSYHFLTDHTFTEPNHIVMKSDKWHADNNQLYLTYSLSSNSFLRWVLSPLQRPVSLTIKSLTDSTALFEKPGTKKYPARFIVLRKAKLNGKYITE